MTYLHAQPRFADAWWPVQGEQAYILAQQERGDSFQLLGTAHKRRSRCGHPPRKLEWRASLRTPRLRAGRFKRDTAYQRDVHPREARLAREACQIHHCRYLGRLNP